MIIICLGNWQTVIQVPYTLFTVGSRISFINPRALWRRHANLVIKFTSGCVAFTASNCFPGSMPWSYLRVWNPTKASPDDSRTLQKPCSQKFHWCWRSYYLLEMSSTFLNLVSLWERPLINVDCSQWETFASHDWCRVCIQPRVLQQGSRISIILILFIWIMRTHAC